MGFKPRVGQSGHYRERPKAAYPPMSVIREERKLHLAGKLSEAFALVRNYYTFARCDTCSSLLSADDWCGECKAERLHPRADEPATEEPLGFDELVAQIRAKKEEATRRR